MTLQLMVEAKHPRVDITWLEDLTKIEANNDTLLCSTYVSPGFGHLSPATDGGKFFTVIYALIGIPITSLFLIDTGMLFKTKFDVLSKKFQDFLSRYISVRRFRLIIVGLVFAIGHYALFVLIPGIIFSIIEGWSYMDAQYFAFIALSTIGLGDLVPTEQVDGWQEWVYKLGTTVYYYTGMVTLVLIGLICQDLLANFEAPEPMMTMDEIVGQDNIGGHMESINQSNKEQDK